MDILFNSSKLRKELREQRLTERRHGTRRAKLLRLRLDQLRLIENLEEIKTLPGTRCHELSGDRAGQLALDLDHPFRLIFEPANEPLPRKPDGGLDWKQVNIVNILEVVDYHG